MASLAFYEAGFADRYVARALGALWPQVFDRNSVQAVCRQGDAISAALQQFPSYFTAVAAELGK